VGKLSLLSLLLYTSLSLSNYERRLVKGTV
jgi:hypothetical protein